MKNLVSRFLFGAAGTGSFSGDFGLLVVRLTVGGYMAASHGWGKVFGGTGFGPSAEMISGVAGLGFPAPTLFAWAAALSEFLGGVLIALGLLTRPAAAMMAFTMLVAAFGASTGWAAREMALLFFAPCLLLLLIGAGRISIDRSLGRAPAASASVANP